MKITLYSFSILILICTSASMVNAMWRGDSSSDEDAPLIPSSGHTSGKAIAKPTAIGTIEYHEDKLAHHQRKNAYHVGMATHLAFTEQYKLVKPHLVESYHSKDMMAAHNDFSEGIKEGRFLPGPKTKKSKQANTIPNPPKSKEEALTLINQNHFKHQSGGKFKHLPLDNPVEKHDKLDKKLSNRHKEDQSSSSSIAHLAITNF